MSRWIKFISERFPLVAQVVLCAGLSLLASGYGMLLAFVGLLLFFFTLRTMDELKDYKKDCVAHPTRPLPRGLISVKEIRWAIWGTSIAMAVFSLTVSFWYGVVLLYLWGMNLEFGAGRFLAERPILYAITHQVVIFPIVVFLFSLNSSAVIFSLHTFLVGLALFGAFFAYEICRKLNPESDPILKTYPQVYGSVNSSIFVIVLAIISGLTNLSIVIGISSLLLMASIIFYLVKTSAFQFAEKYSMIHLIICIYTLGILS